jgi:hypothetical protein
MQNQQVAAPEADAMRGELATLYAKRRDYTEQLEILTDRRGALADQIARTESGLRTGPQNRLVQIDERIAKLEKEAQQTDDRISTLLNRGVTTEPAPTPEIPAIPPIPSLPGFEFTMSPPPFSDPAVRKIIAGEAIGFLILTAVLCRWTWTRARRRFAAIVPRNDAHLQQAVDAIAIEVERISEGQRFVTAILNHRLEAKDARSAAPATTPKPKVITPV